MASFKSILSEIGHFVARAFSPGAIAVEATIAEIALPQFTNLIAMTSGAIINAENASIVAGVQSGSGVQKSAIVISQIETAYTAFALANGIPVVPANIKSFVDAIVTALNSFPAPTGVAK